MAFRLGDGRSNFLAPWVLYRSICSFQDKNTPSHYLRVKKILRGWCNEKLLRGLFRKLLRSFGTEHQTTQRALHKRKIARETATQHIETHISARQPGKYKTLGWSKTLVAPKPIRLILAKQRHACVFGENCSQSVVLDARVRSCSCLCST